jgi:hypothetical protein
MGSDPFQGISDRSKEELNLSQKHSSADANTLATTSSCRLNIVEPTYRAPSAFSPSGNIEDIGDAWPTTWRPCMRVVRFSGRYGRNVRRSGLAARAPAPTRTGD